MMFTMRVPSLWQVESEQIVCQALLFLLVPVDQAREYPVRAKSKMSNYRKETESHRHSEVKKSRLRDV